MIDALIAQANPQLVVAAIVAATIHHAPRIIAALILFVLGRSASRQISKVAVKLIEGINLKRVVQSFELGISISTTTQQNITQVIGLVTRYSVLYLTFTWIFDLLGFSQIAHFLKNLAGLLPKFASSLFIIGVGLILSGFVESIVKQAFKSFDPATARLSGRMASYIVITFFILISLAEIGLASFFINTLFIGFVSSLALAFALAVGLGSKDIINRVLDSWYNSKVKKRK